ncbi:MAG TPA: hypothetical protein PK357_02710 [Candidatus Pacearchaeota archaeon]|nr:hypothetical protein [Candidatus Pacearchaeota archaeon]
MKTWIIASMILGLLIIGGFAFVSALNNNNAEEANNGETLTDIPTKTISCSGCGNGCNAESNCGLATCGAVSGTGSCGCGK